MDEPIKCSKVDLEGYINCFCGKISKFDFNEVEGNQIYDDIVNFQCPYCGKEIPYCTYAPIGMTRLEYIFKLFCLKEKEKVKEGNKNA